MRPYSGSHAFVSTTNDRATVEAIAAREQWRTELVDNGPFQVLNVWVENQFLLEVATPDLIAGYLATFGPAGVQRLDDDLRALESQVA
jgi:hypothetical protein